ncbi:MAG: hypothetical protein AVDCRST_MAG30-2510 [uncultured Solirubrobacteraceae bacterium]|uniref:Fibronectin type-III domain-containing protein n=1 Tax=uncultured Solirubrobacteraceae bacterium TaxID=1162706 RepID=A0A6J4T1P3_9ACTN|nr:MAG: hypothetical protein AVDCRST_MAG30-2510 [uncultured Solirubrobacteraceae bacterium]
MRGQRRRSTYPFAAVLAALLALLAASPSAQGGVNVGLVLAEPYNELVGLSNDFGAKQHRFDVPYTRDPASAAPRVASLIADGVKPVLLLNGPTYPSATDPAAYGAAAGAWAEYYKPGGAFMAGKDINLLPDFELWNEPYVNWIGGAGANGNPASYAALVKAASPRIRQASPRFRIIIGGEITGLAGGGYPEQDWVAGLYGAGLTNAMFDLVTAHPYGYYRPLNASPEDRWGFPRLQRIIERFKARGFDGRFMITEHGHPSGPASETDLPLGGTEAGQERYWRETLATIDSTPLYRDNIETVFAYQPFDWGDGSSVEHHFGLYKWVHRQDQNGSGGDLAPKQALAFVRGRTRASIVPGVFPDGPRRHRVKRNPSNTIEHAWEPLPGATAGYVAALLRPDGTTWYSSVPAGTTRKVWPNLPSGTYRVDVRGAATGSSAGRYTGRLTESAAAPSRTHPQAPARLRVWARGNDYLEPAWDPVAGGNGSYVVVLKSAGMPDYYRLVSGTSYRWTGLTRGRTYRISVAAKNSSGTTGGYAPEISGVPSPAH